MSVHIHPEAKYLEFRTRAALPFSHVEQVRGSLSFFLERWAVPCESPAATVTLDSRHADRVAFAVQILAALHPCPAQLAAGCRALDEPPTDHEAEGFWVMPGGELALRIWWGGLDELETVLAGLFDMAENHIVRSGAAEHMAAGLVALIRWLCPSASDFERTAFDNPADRDTADRITGQHPRRLRHVGQLAETPAAQINARLMRGLAALESAGAVSPGAGAWLTDYAATGEAAPMGFLPFEGEADGATADRLTRCVLAGLAHLERHNCLPSDFVAGFAALLAETETPFPDIHGWLCRFVETGIFPPLPFDDGEAAAAPTETKSPATAANGAGQ